MPRNLRILVHQRWRFEFGASIVEGVMDYAIHNTGWEIVPSGDESSLSLNRLRRLRIDGFIGDGFHTRMVDAARALGVPFIDVTGAAPSEGLHSIVVDDAAVGAMAARHFLIHGIRNSAFIGFANHQYSVRRRDAFLAGMAEAGLKTALWEDDFVADTLPVADPELVRFIGALPKPCGIFACSDLRAWSSVLACRQRGWRIPEDVALLGVDNDQRLIRLMRVQLSSIDTGPFFVGWEAARMLHRMIEGRHIVPPHTVLAPIQVVERASTRGLASENPSLKRFVEWIQHEGIRGTPVSDAARSIGCSRRNLEALCRRHLGASPHQMVMRARMEKALERVVYSHDSLREVAESMGFQRQSDLTRLFRRLLGCSPQSFRRR